MNPIIQEILEAEAHLSLAAAILSSTRPNLDELAETIEKSRDILINLAEKLEATPKN